MIVPTLVGISGHFAGEIRPLEHGKTIVVGRSRSADVSLRRTEKYRLQSDAEHDKDEIAQMISGKHFQITFQNLQYIELKNLSVNGTYLDGQITDHAVITDIEKKSHEIKFGWDSVFRLEMRDTDLDD